MSANIAIFDFIIKMMVCMMEFIEVHNLTGIVIGAVTFLIIGLFHPVVIKSEYYFGVGCWWFFLLLGLGAILCSVLVGSTMLSIIFGVIGFSSLWSIGEIFEQRQRVEKGWFPANPNRTTKKRLGKRGTNN